MSFCHLLRSDIQYSCSTTALSWSRQVLEHRWYVLITTFSNILYIYLSSICICHDNAGNLNLKKYIFIYSSINNVHCLLILMQGFRTPAVHNYILFTFLILRIRRTVIHWLLLLYCMWNAKTKLFVWVYSAHIHTAHLCHYAHYAFLNTSIHPSFHLSYWVVGILNPIQRDSGDKLGYTLHRIPVYLDYFVLIINYTQKHTFSLKTQSCLYGHVWNCGAFFCLHGAFLNLPQH